MPQTLRHLSDLNALKFDTVIDVRSPSEYAEDHIPGAISLPVLSDAERAEVGTIYVQDSPFMARKIGAALVARNAAHHLETALADRPKGFTPLVYCWRGGQRSGSFALILKQVGWQADTVEGGYRAFRRLVKSALYDDPWPCPVVVLDGNTGTAKTDILKRAGAMGAQVLDLEGMANHRGSVFGPMAGGQPSQKAFETRLAMAAAALDPARPVLVEAESTKIGDINLPPSLWAAMKTAPRVVIEAPIAARAGYLVSAYAEIAADRGALAETIARLSTMHSTDRISEWAEMAQTGSVVDLAAELITDHYDPRYRRQRARHTPEVIGSIALFDLSEGQRAEAAARVAEVLAS